MDTTLRTTTEGRVPKGWSTAKRWCVVLMAAEDCIAYTFVGRCVMAVRGPYTRTEAEEVMTELPEWTAPHLMMLDREEEEDGKQNVDDGR